MKKVLFASTALVLAAGVASADVKITGEAGAGWINDGVRGALHTNIEFFLSGTVATDSGVTVGASSDLGSASHTSTGSLTDVEVFVSTNGFTLSAGQISNAADNGIGDIGYDGIGIDNLAENGGIDSHNLRGEFAVADITVAASADVDNTGWALGVSGDIDAFEFSVAFAETNAGADVVNVVVGYSAGAFSVDAMYRDNGTTDSYGLIGSYTTGDVTVSAAYADNGTVDGWGIGVAYDLGGATVAAGFGDNGTNDVYDLGVSFDF
jgi:outer membrane protein OmpU